MQAGLKVKTNGDYHLVDLAVMPLAEPDVPPGLLMIIFQDMGPVSTDRKKSAQGQKLYTDFENELRLTKESLQTTIEELEATNEELKSANEELQSNNEEMQSTNEELDTSREELQSLNEELTTLNAELQDKNELLSKANDDLKNFLNRTDIAIIFLDENLRIRRYTPAASNIFNVRDIDNGRPIDEITSRLEYDDFAGDAQEVMRTLRPKETEVKRKDGAWYKMRILPYLTAQNAVSGLVISFSDIDEQKKAQNSLNNLNQQLEDLARFPKENPFPVLRVKKDGTILYANAACFSLDFAICQTGRILPDIFITIVTEVLGSGLPKTMEMTGEARIFSLSFIPIIEAGYVNIYGMDITEQKKLDTALKESEVRFRVLSETSPVGMGVSSLEGTLLYTNPSYEAILGYGPAELIGKKATDLYLHPEDRVAWLQGMNSSGAISYSETRLKKKDGSSIWASISASPITFDGRQAIFGTIQDISDIKQAEESLIKYSRELELTNKDLESFSFSVQHDLRAPLRALDGFSEIMIQDFAEKLDTTGKDYLHRIRSASQTMSRLIDDMARLYRTSRVEVRLSHVNLSEIAESILAELKNGQPERKADFVIAPGIFVNADLNLITILFRNLLENAWKFTKKCAITQIEFGVCDLEGMKTFFIKDNGTGFDKIYADKLFKPFQRLHDEKDYEGSGIGLAIAEKVIARHNGMIWAEAAINEGTTIYFTLVQK